MDRWQDDLSNLLDEVVNPSPPDLGGLGTPTLDFMHHFIPPDHPPVSSDEMTVLDPMVAPPNWAQVLSDVLTGGSPTGPAPSATRGGPINPLPRRP